MSGIYIPNMEMPTSCGECKFFAWKRVVGQHCVLDDRITFHATIDGVDVFYERNGNCPLVPVPPHGRLIDADALMRHKGNCYDADGHLLYAVGTGNILRAPTIIEAEEGE